MKSVAIFNNKGGVGKTTLLCNLAAYLAIKERYKILVVDADPQCNASQSMFSDTAIHKHYKQNDFTVQHIVRPLAIGKGFSKSLEPKRSKRFGLDVILGDPAMSLNEDLLASDWVAATGGNLRGLRTTFLFLELLSRCNTYDYVFFDVGPSLGSINRSVLLAVDAFVSPMSIDIFSLKALDNISTQINDWKKKLQRGIEDIGDTADLGVDTPKWRSRFAGYVTQQYTKKTEGGQQRPVRAYDEVMKQMPEKIQQRLIDELGEEGTAESKLLGTIPLLHSLVPMSQTSRAPIFDLKAADGVVGAHFTRVREFEETIGSIATRFEEEMESV